MTDCNPKSVLSVHAELGGQPIWSAAESSLYWLDIVGAKINRFHPQSGENKSWDRSVFPGCLVFRKGGGAVLAAHDPEITCFNDGRTDRQDRFWAGTVRKDMDQDNTPENAYYRYDRNGLIKMLSNVGQTNGTAFSPDGATIGTEGAYRVAVVPPGDPAKPGVLRCLPDGSLDLFIELPVPFVTMPAFGGPNLSTLYITTARLEAFMPG